jgi:hypothetical protein
MRSYEVKRRRDGRWEVSPGGSAQPLLVFDSNDELAAFARLLAVARPDAERGGGAELADRPGGAG